MNRFRKTIIRILAVSLSAVLIAASSGCGKSSLDDLINEVANMGNGFDSSAGSYTTQTMPESENDVAGAEENTNLITAMARKLLLGSFAEESEVEVTASVEEPGLMNFDDAVNSSVIYMQDGMKSMLLENGFVVSPNGFKEFFKTYEMNRYERVANFVTVDSMMHAYHMYFAYLLKNTERTYLEDKLLSLSESMLEESRNQYDQLKGTEWENAAERNVAYFTIGAALQNENETIDPEVADTVNTELNSIYAAGGIENSVISGTFLDYSQFKPRGYYEGDVGLENYFRAMMWYGQIGFVHSNEDMDRSAALIIMAMEKGGFDQWEEIYSVTSFFAGASDDLSYYEIMPALQEAFGDGFTVSDITGNSEAWNVFRGYIDAMDPPAINSIPTIDDGDMETKSVNENKGFRFMGQRFSIDAAIFQQLIYDNVGDNKSGDRRMLPDTLDVAAALGSETAYSILEQQGDTDYDGYTENMESLRNAISMSEYSLWSASLYSAWIHTLTPLLEKKGSGYPKFMQSEEWAKKNIESFAGSYTELKHDTVLYAKQVMAEMGGGPIPEVDTRGYVEPEVSVWARFETLARKTIDGLDYYSILTDIDRENLNHLRDLAAEFREMSEKELRGELLSAEEYELIEYFGGELEHLWEAALADEEKPLNMVNYPAALVTDIATDPNGYCLEVATGNPSEIYVLAYFDGGYHICCGAMYTFYQFSQPLSERLTDSEWRQMMGLETGPDGSYDSSSKIDQPSWTQSYRYSYR